VGARRRSRATAGPLDEGGSIQIEDELDESRTTFSSQALNCGDDGDAGRGLGDDHRDSA